LAGFEDVGCEAEMKVMFNALIKQNTIKSLVSGDKQARLTLEFEASDDDVMDKINKLHKADETVTVIIGSQ